MIDWFVDACIQLVIVIIERISIVASLSIDRSIARREADRITSQPTGYLSRCNSSDILTVLSFFVSNVRLDSLVKMRWIGPDGRQITEDRSQRVHAESTGPHGHRLVVMNATSEVDDGQYNCTLGSTDDRQPREYIGFNLKIFMTTNFKDTPQHLVLTAGQPGTLTCRVEFDSNASGSINWFRDQLPIEVFNDTHYKTIDYDPGKQYSQLILSPVTKQNDGTYTCRAVAVTSQLSKISDFDIRLETNYGPEFDKEHEIVWVERFGQSTANRYLLMPAHLSDRLPAGSSSVNPYMHHSHHQTMLPPGMLLGAAAVAGAAASAGMRNQHHHQQQQQQPQQPQQAQTPHQHPSPQQYPHQPTNTHAGRGRVGGGRGGKRGRAFAPEVDQTGGYDQMSTTDPMSNSTGQVIRVELRCTCRANPQASILWISTNSQFALAKGQPAHIIEQPMTEYDGHNATSILTIAYNLDPDWPHRRDVYFCSASNRIGKANKRYTIEQGDPPPAFNIGPYKEYDSERSLFKFTLLGPNFDPYKSNSELMNRQPSSSSVSVNNNLGDSNTIEIVPPVDSFRIRAESPSGGIQMQQPSSSGTASIDHSGGGQATTRYHTQHSTGGRSSTGTASRRVTSPTGNSEPVVSVEWSVVTTSETAAGGADGLALVARNQTVNLGKLPSGHQRLYLEAHNAVGWSPNATYIGDYYIVSGANTLHLSGPVSLSIYLLTTFWHSFMRLH